MMALTRSGSTGTPATAETAAAPREKIQENMSNGCTAVSVRVTA
jgi:hypothetical protein